MVLILACTDTTWRSFRSKSKPREEYDGDTSDMAGKTASLRQRKPRAIRLNSSLSGFRSTQKLSEVELHSIKTSFQAIESLWQDLSLGMDSISINLLSRIHENLGEIGSELFGKLFLNNSNLKEVISLLILNRRI